MNCIHISTIAAFLGAPLLLSGRAGADGNVTVHVDGQGNLVVVGDGADNAISIMPFDIGEGFVRGLDGTLVNGSEQAPFTGAGGDFRIRMHGGDDTVEVDDGDGNEVLGDLEVETGTGDDTVLVRHFIAHGDLSIHTGPGHDRVRLEQTAGLSAFAEGRTDVRTGAGNDQVIVTGGDPSLEAFVRFQGAFRVATGQGRDFVSVSGAIFFDAVEVDLGAGDDLGSTGGPPGGVCVCGSTFLADPVLGRVSFRGGGGVDGGVLESVCGIAPPGLVDDFLDVESEPDDCSFLGGTACSGSCPPPERR